MTTAPRREGHHGSFALEEPAPRAYTTSPSPGQRSDRPYEELWCVCVAPSIPRACLHQADGRTDCPAAAPGSPGPTSGQDTSTDADQDSNSERKRGNRCAESGVRDPLFFSRTTVFCLSLYQNMAEDHTCKGVGECHPYREFEGMQPSR
jgi:hypothetical protein